MESNVKAMVTKMIEKNLGAVNEIQLSKPLGEIKPLGWASDQLQVVVKFSSKNQQDLQLFLKMCKEDTRPAMLNKNLFTFDKEIYFYENIAPIYSSALKQMDRNLFVTYYGSETVDHSIYIILEDFTANDFYVTSKEEFHNLAIISSVIKNLAVFHACYFKANQNDRDEWENYLSNLHNIYHPTKHEFIRPFFHTQFKNSLKVLKAIATEKSNQNVILNNNKVRAPDNQLIVKLENISSSVVDVFHFVSTRKSKFYCLCHGDFHMWNVALFKGEKTALKFFDFQEVQFNSLVIDILQYLYQASPPEFRKQHLQIILKEYCDSFNAVLKDFQPEKMITPEELYIEYKTISMWGFLCGFIYLLQRHVSEDFLTKLESIDDCKSKEIVDLLINESASDELWNIVNCYTDMLNEAEELGTFDVMQLMRGEV